MIWKLPAQIAVALFGLLIMIPIYFLVIGGRSQEAHFAFEAAITLWHQAPWSALASIWSGFGNAIRTSATSIEFDLAIVIYVWTVSLYAIPYLAIFMAAMVLRLALARRTSTGLLRLLSVVSGLGLILFSLCLLTIVASWLAGFFYSFFWEASTAGAP